MMTAARVVGPAFFAERVSVGLAGVLGDGDDDVGVLGDGIEGA